MQNTRSPRPHRRRSRRPTRHEISAGGVVVRQVEGVWSVVLLQTAHKRGNVWVLPKGHIEPQANETPAVAAAREVQEEAGIKEVSVKEELGVTRYAFLAEDALVKKTVHYFLMTTSQIELTPQAEEDFTAAIWCPLEEAVLKLAYDTDQKIVATAYKYLTGKSLSLPVAPTPLPLHHAAHRHVRIHT